MIEPLLWSILCAAALALCWVKIRTGGMMMAIIAAGFGILYGQSGWSALMALGVAADAIAAGLEPPPFRVSVLIAAPLIITLAWPALRGLFAREREHAHGSA